MYAETFIMVWKFILPLLLLGYIAISLGKKKIPFVEFFKRNKDIFGYFIIQIICMVGINFLIKYEPKDNVITQNLIDIPNIVKLFSTGVLFLFGVVFIVILLTRLCKKYVPVIEED